MRPYLNGREVWYLYELLSEVKFEDLVNEYRIGGVCEALKVLKAGHL